MNEITKLFVRHLEASAALEAREDYVAALPDGAAVFKYMDAIHKEWLVFVAGVNLMEAAVYFQE